MNARRVNYSDCPNCGYKGALSVTVKDGQELFHCHAGCPQESLWRVIRDERPLTYQPAPETHRRVNLDSLPYIQKLWKQGLPAAGSPVEIYLATRGLMGLIPPALRFLPDHPHKPTNTHWPVMLAAVTDANGRLQAIHRTYLARNGKGKAPVEPAKMTLGPMGGYACHLAPAEEKLAVTEGIETALSVSGATELSTWAALSAGGIQNLILPSLPLASEVVICADHDANGCGQVAARTAATRWRDEGRRVRIALPPDPGTDFNDLLTSKKQEDMSHAFA